MEHSPLTDLRFSSAEQSRYVQPSNKKASAKEDGSYQMVFKKSFQMQSSQMPFICKISIQYQWWTTCSLFTKAKIFFLNLKLIIRELKGCNRPMGHNRPIG